MSYTKLAVPLAGVADALAQALSQNSVTEPVADDLQAAGASVQLETSTKVWVSCVVHDKPETPQIDFLTVAIAFDSAGDPWLKANGQLVCNVFWSGLWPDCLAALGIDTVRKALLMVALGESQPQVSIPTPAEGGPTQQDAIPGIAADSCSIRPSIKAALELSAPLADVL